MDAHGEICDPSTLARQLGCSSEAVDLTRACEVIDLHLDTFIPPRLWGYDPLVRHHTGPLGRRFFGHVDVPRLREGGLSGAMWSITTNPWRSREARWRAFLDNLREVRALIERSRGLLAEACTLAELRAVRARGAHACLLAIQGANALEAAPSGVASIPDDCIVRATLVHLLNSSYGATSSPLGYPRAEKGLSELGRELVAQLDARRVFVDLAHIHPTAFWQAVEAHDRSLPLIATHTGVCGVTPHWRNLDDRQIRAIADTGGVVGIIFSEAFLRRPGGPVDGAMIVEHMEHLARVAGDDAVAIGSDFDGAITPPADLPGANAYPKLVQHMLDRGWREEQMRKALGENFLRAFGALRPGATAPA
jgi:membrane dipeptidase